MTRAVALAVVLLAAAVGPSGRASAQDSTGVTARLAAQTLLVRADETASVVLDVAGTLPEDTEISVVVHNRLPASRDGFRQAADGDIPTAAFRLLTTQLADVPRDAAGRLNISIPTTSKRGSSTGTTIPLRTPGVYPVDIRIRSGERNDEIARVVTFLVRLPDQPVDAPMRLALVMPVTGSPPLRPDGSVAIDPAVRARLQTLADLLATDPALALSVQIQPELLEALARTGVPTDDELRARLLAGLSGRQTLPATYVAMDPTAALAAGLGDELVKQLRRGEDVLADQVGAASAERSIWTAAAGLDGSALTSLRDLGFRQLVVPAIAVERGDIPDTRPASLATPQAGSPLSVAVADAGLSEAFGSHADPVRDAYLWLAELALVALEPDDTRADLPTSPRGLVVLPTGWVPDAAFLGTLLTGLRSNPLVVPVTVAQLFEQVAPAVNQDGGPVERVLAPTSPQDLRSYADALARARNDLASYGSMLPPTSPMSGRLGQLLDVSPSSELDAAGRTEYLAAVDAELDSLRRAVDPVAARTVTLAGRTTELPLTITSRSDDPLQVKVRLSSSKLAFPEGDELLVMLTGGAAQVRVPVEARTSGTFPVNIELLTPVGDLPVAPATQLTVRSTGLSGLGLALSVGALLVLALWWFRHVRKARRRRRASVASERHPSTGALPVDTHLDGALDAAESSRPAGAGH